jgi:hypothetical protein
MSPLNFPSARARKALYCVILSVVCLVCVPGLAQSQTDQPVLKITPVAPAIIYPIELSKERRLSAFTVFCEDFEHITAESAKNDIGLFLDQTKVLNITWSAPPHPPDKPDAHQVYAALDPANKQLDLWLPWADYSGKIQLQLERFSRSDGH